MKAAPLLLLSVWQIMQTGESNLDTILRKMPNTSSSVRETPHRIQHLPQKSKLPVNKPHLPKPKETPLQPDFHQLLPPEELLHYFGTNKRQEVPAYAITTPRHVSGSRRRREVMLGKDKLLYHVTAFGEDYWLELKHNNKLMSHGCIVEENINGSKHMSPCFKSRLDAEDSDNDCFYIGASIFHTGSTVAVSTCFGLKGFISVPHQGHDLIIQPIKAYHSALVPESRTSEVLHLVVKRQAESRVCGGAVKFLNSGTIAGHTSPDKAGHSISKRSSSSSSSSSSDLHMEVVLVADKTLYDFHGSDLKNFLLAVTNVAAARMLDSSLGHNIHISVTKINILSQDDPSLEIVEDASHGLQSFCDWQEKTNAAQGAQSQRYDLAVLFTRLDLYHSTSGRSIVGLANEGGMCVTNRRCLYIEDTGLDTGLTLAHEIGHSLGLVHDSDNNSCPDLTNMMSSAGATGPNSFKWSSCSRNSLSEFINSGAGFCLTDSPIQGETLPKDLPGVVYDADDQCQLWAGAMYYQHDDDPCSQLWCHDPKTVDGILKASSAMMDGSMCGHRKYCLNAQCVDIGANGPPAVDGGWSDWSPEWTECSRTCGGGVRTKVRQCNNPKPRLGGNNCSGPSRKIDLCNVKPCNTSQQDYKTEQCNATRDDLLNGLVYDWVPWDSAGDLECSLMCQSQPDNRIFRRTLNGSTYFQDGTICQGSQKSDFHRCVEGSCQAISCDGHSDSTYTFDVCGVCGGSGNICTGSKNYGTNMHGEAGRWSTFAKFTVGMSDIQIVNKNSFAKMTLSIGGVPIFNDDPSANAATGNYSLHGVNFSYVRAVGLDAEHLSVQGPLQVEVEAQVFIMFDEPQFQPDITYEFVNPLNVSEYSWRSETIPCSSECDNGNYKVEVTCQQENDSSVVEDRFCNIFEKPDVVGGPCRSTACQPFWSVGFWGECTKNCSGGVQTRHVDCVQQSGGQYIVVTDNLCDPSLKPEVTRSCNVPVCDAQWETSDWSVCSMTCGRGVRTRNVTCMSGDREVNVSNCHDSKPSAMESCVQEVCNTVNDCKDVNPNCAIYDLTNVCQQYESWARANCMRSCAFCAVWDTPVCEDKSSECATYGRTICTNQYASWAKENCAKFCDSCVNSSFLFPSSSTCADKIADCSIYGQSACGGMYAEWAKINCANFCNLCGSTSMTLSTALSSSHEPSSTLPSLLSSSPPETLPTLPSSTMSSSSSSLTAQGTVPNKSCQDKSLYCSSYGSGVCSGDFAKWAEENCEKFCGYCESTTSSAASSMAALPLSSSSQLNKPLTSCKDINSYCSMFGLRICSGDGSDWAQENCAQFCGFCVTTSSMFSATSDPHAAVSTASCVDKEPNCAGYGTSICTGEYQAWATTHCASFCGHC